MATYAVAPPAAVIRDIFYDVAEVEQVFLSTDEDRGVSVLIVIDGKDYTVLRRIFDLETVIINALPGTSITFDVVVREGRPLGDIVSPRGRSLFQR